MSSRFGLPARVGRLHDPLFALTERIHRLLSAHGETVWIDQQGGVFVLDSGKTGLSAGSIMGRYTRTTSTRLIEADLRHALRERASAWIVDWNAVQIIPGSRHGKRFGAHQRWH